MALPKLLISVSNISEFRPMAKEIPADRITPYIQEAQQFDLKRLLGDPLYLDFLAKFDSSVDPQYTNYQNLLNGVNYTYGNLTLANPGLIGYLSYSTLVRFYNNNQINATRYGLVQKTNDQSQPLDWKAIAVAVAELRSNALAFQEDIIKYLMANASSFPLYAYQDGSALGQTGVKFFDLNSDNYPAQNGRTLTSF
jgi:hypothetical protein